MKLFQNTGMQSRQVAIIALLGFIASAHSAIESGNTIDPGAVTIVETSKAGNKYTVVDNTLFQTGTPSSQVVISLDASSSLQRQEIEGFGGSLTEASAWTLQQISSEKRQEVIDNFFKPEKNNYNLTRIHIASSDFSLTNYTYAPTEDVTLSDFSIQEDMDDVVPLIQDAISASGQSLKVMASPWTAPPWMKGPTTKGNPWFGGHLLPQHYSTFALYMSKFIQAYKDQGIPIWSITPENEPHGNDEQWESMSFSVGEMIDYVKNHLGPTLAEDHPEVEIYAYDQNKGDDMESWMAAMMADPVVAQYTDGIAAHWYSSTIPIWGSSLDFLNTTYPDLKIIASEATIDGLGGEYITNQEERPIGIWFNNDQWWWEPNHSDWGWDWSDRALHPLVEPVYRLARDIMEDLNHWVVGWIDWNFVLNKRGGPNHASNWCGATVMIDVENDADIVYYTPLYYTLGHFSKYIQRGSRIISSSVSGNSDIDVTAAINPDGSIALVVLNDTPAPVNYAVTLAGKNIEATIDADAIQTVLIKDGDFTVGISEQGLVTPNARPSRITNGLLFSNLLNNNSIELSLTEPGNYSLNIFDITGKKVATTQTGFLMAGTQSFALSESAVGNGIYFIKAEKIH